MSKKRRTRHEKMVSQEKQRHLITQSSTGEAQYSFQSSVEMGKIHELRPTLTQTSYSYVIKDIRRSLTVTFLIILASIMFFILIQTQIINLTNIGY